MPLNFGELSFRRGGSNVVGLPLDVIDKVGSTLTQRYYQNRETALKQKMQAMNLPDANAEGNKQVIAQISKEVDDTFSQYSKEDKWFDADKAVFDTAEKLMSDQRVKSLNKFAAQAAAVDKSIESSGASEHYQMLRRAYNQQVNQQGILDAKGGYSRQYQGKTITGKLDMTEYIKKYDDLVKGWKADKKTYADGLGKVNVDTLSDGFKQVYYKYGKSSIESVNEQEVEKFLMDVVQQDSKLKAELGDIAELDLFERTGKFAPDMNDMTALISDRANRNPYWQNAFIMSSSKFANDTKNMKPNEVQAYYNKMAENSSKRAEYIQSGAIEYLQHMPPQLIDVLYKDAYVTDFRGTLQGVAKKNSYIKQDADVSYLADNLATHKYEEHMKVKSQIPIVNNNGQISKEGVLANIDKRNDTLNTLRLQQAIADSPTSTLEQKAAASQRVKNIQSELNALDYITGAFKKSLGVKDEDIINANKDVITEAIRVPQQSLSASYGNNAKRNDMSPSEAKAIFNVVSANRDKSAPEIVKLLKEQGVTTNAADVTNALTIMQNTVKSSIKEIMDKAGTTHLSVPVESIGNIGANDMDYQNAIKYYTKQFSLSLGDFSIIDAGEDLKDFVGGVNAGVNLSMNVKKEGVTQAKGYELTLEPAYMRNDDGKFANLQMFRVNWKDNEGKGHQALVRYNGNDTMMRDITSNIIQQAAKNYTNPKSPFKDTNLHTFKTMLGLMGGYTNVTSIGDKEMSNMTLGNALNNLPEKANDYPDIVVKSNGVPIKIHTQYHPDTDKYSQRLTVYNGKDWEPLMPYDLGNLSSPNGAAQYIGAFEERLKAGGDIETVTNITNIMRLP
jgi:hypothetical protein